MTEEETMDAGALRLALEAHYHKFGRHGTPGMSCNTTDCAADIAARLAVAPAEGEPPTGLLADGIEAFRLTREYVGEDTLPAIPGWSWFDWVERARIRGTTPLDAEVLERAWREHILDDRPGKGWPHTRGGPMPGDGPQPIDGCDDLCADDILSRILDALRAALAQPPAPASADAARGLERLSDFDKGYEAAIRGTTPLDAATAEVIAQMRREHQHHSPEFTCAGCARIVAMDVALRGQPSEPASEYGRLLAERDRLVGTGIDPADLLVPDQPSEPDRG